MTTTTTLRLDLEAEPTPEDSAEGLAILLAGLRMTRDQIAVAVVDREGHATVELTDRVQWQMRVASWSTTPPDKRLPMLRRAVRAAIPAELTAALSALGCPCCYSAMLDAALRDRVVVVATLLDQDAEVRFARIARP